MEHMSEGLQEQLAQWHEGDEFQKIVDVLLAIPEEERSYELTGQLARALNNLEDYETAVEILLGAETEGENDPLWHYRLGYAYYYSNRFELARDRFLRVLELAPEDGDARMFLGWCDEQLSPTVKTDRLNQRLMAAESMMVGATFRERADAFWEWFTENEAELSQMVERREPDDVAKMVEFISAGVKLISEDVNFNVGGNYEFTFAVEGHHYLFYLLPWLIARMPEEFRWKWHFSPYMQGTAGENFGFRMYDKDIPLEEVMVALHYDEERNYFDVRFWHKELCALPKEESCNAFYIMMELAVGEGVSRIYIRQVEQADALEKGMFPMTKLEGCIAMALEEAGKEMSVRPDERYTVYKMDFDEAKDLRYDMVVGNTCFMELVQEYFDEETTSVDGLDNSGAEAVFLVIPFGDADRSDLLKLRYEIEDRLTAELLGERGSGQEIGILLGGMAGRDYLYIDLLLYDTPAFLAGAGDLLMQYPYPFYLAEFRSDSRLVALAGVEADIPEIPKHPSALAREMMAYMDCSCDWFAPMADAQALDDAYFAALKAGKQGRYVPVLVKVNEMLKDCLVANVEGSSPYPSKEEVQAFRQGLLKEAPLFDAVKYLGQLIRNWKEKWVKKGQTEEEVVGTMADGQPDSELSGYWNYETRLTDEMLLVRVPVDEPWKIFAWLPMGDWNNCPFNEGLMAVAKRWYEAYGAIPAIITDNELEFYVPRPVNDKKVAMQLAWEHYAICPECVHQSKSNDTIGKRADALRQSKVWYFGWDYGVD